MDPACEHRPCSASHPQFLSARRVAAAAAAGAPSLRLRAAEEARAQRRLRTQRTRPLPRVARAEVLFPESPRRMRSGKTALLFQFAVNAAQQGQRVFFFCHRERLEFSPPALPPDSSATPEVLERISIRRGFPVHTPGIPSTSASQSPRLRQPPLAHRAPRAPVRRACVCLRRRRYLEDDAELRRWCANVHLLPTPRLPTVLLVDELASLANRRG